MAKDEEESGSKLSSVQRRLADCLAEYRAEYSRQISRAFEPETVVGEEQKTSVGIMQGKLVEIIEEFDASRALNPKP
jgi:hypothetical protein